MLNWQGRVSFSPEALALFIQNTLYSAFLHSAYFLPTYFLLSSQLPTILRTDSPSARNLGIQIVFGVVLWAISHKLRPFRKFSATSTNSNDFWWYYPFSPRGVWQFQPICSPSSYVGGTKSTPRLSTTRSFWSSGSGDYASVLCTICRFSPGGFRRSTSISAGRFYPRGAEPGGPLLRSMGPLLSWGLGLFATGAGIARRICRAGPRQFFSSSFLRISWRRFAGLRPDWIWLWNVRLTSS